MNYKIIDNEKDFFSLKENWNLLALKMRESTPFQAWEWNFYYWKYNESYSKLKIIIAFEDNLLMGIAPLVVKQKRIEFIGDKNIDYGEFLAINKTYEIIEGFLKIILKENNYEIHLQEMAGNNTQYHMVKKILEKNNKVLFRETVRTTRIHLSDYNDFHSYISTLSQSLRNKTIKSGLNSGIIIKEVEPSQELFKEVARIYEDRQVERIGVSRLNWAFPIVKELVEQKYMEIHIAECNGRIIAFKFTFFYKNSSYLWITAFEQKYHKLNPGQLLCYQMIKEGYEKKYILVDFMRGDYPFKIRWNTEIFMNYEIIIYKNILNCIFYKLFYSIRKKIRDFVYENEKLKKIYKKLSKL